MPSTRPLSPPSPQPFRSHHHHHHYHHRCHRHVMDQLLIHRAMIYYTSRVSRATVRRDTMLYKKRTALARASVLDPSQLLRLFRKHSLLVHDHRPYFLPGVVCHKRIVPASHVSRTSSSGLGKTKGEERRRERERERN